MTPNEFIVPVFAFAAVAIAVYAISIYSAKPQVDKRLEKLNTLGGERTIQEVTQDSTNTIVRCLGPIVPALLRPRSEKELNTVRLRLARAGLTSGGAVEVYLVWRTLAAAITILLATAAWLGLYNYGPVASVLAASVILSIGFLMPDAMLRMRTNTRQKQILRSLPEAVDLMVVGIEVGLGLDAVLRNVADEMRGSARALCAELDLYNSQLQMGVAKRDALHELGVRAGLSELNSFACTLIQAERYGSSIAQALREQSDFVRQRQRSRAEEKAQQASVKLILPLVLFIFPGIFVVLVGPAALNLMHEFCNL